MMIKGEGTGDRLTLHFILLLYRELLTRCELT